MNPIARTVRKRNGTMVPYDAEKIRRALWLCFNTAAPEMLEPERAGDVEQIVVAVSNVLTATANHSPGVEDIQRLVIQQLWGRGLFPAAEHYQNYREERRRARAAQSVPPAVLEQITADRGHFPTDLQYYQFMSKFSRWNDTARRRETWRETVYDRVIPWLVSLPGVSLLPGERSELESAMFDLEVSPAMRVVQMAGPALERCNVGAYNCAYHPLQDTFAFAELLYILMQGTGAGFSCESEYISRLPRVKKQNGKVIPLRCEDTTESWCDTFHRHLELLWDGYDTDIDTSAVRPTGSRLKTKGGRASGPGPLLELLAFARRLLKSRAGRFLEDIDAHDLACMIGRIVQVGGVRRAAEISLSDLDSYAMRNAKSGNWWEGHMHRSMANNCLPVGTLIHTQRGSVPIEDIVVGDVVVTPAGMKPVTAHVDSGTRQTLVIRHTYGELECTPEHRVAVFDTVDTWTFRAARDVRPGDALVFDHTGYDGVPTQFPEYHVSVSSRSRKIDIPKLDSEMAWLLGVFHGDGNTSFSNVSKHTGNPTCGRVAIACSSDVSVMEPRLIAAFSRFGVYAEASTQTSKWGGCRVVRANSLELAKYFNNEFKQSDSEIVVPECILNGTRPVRAGYLAGLLDSDGSALDTSVYLAFSVYPEFLRQVRSIATSLGIATRLSIGAPRPQNPRPIHELKVYGVEPRRLFDSVVGVYSSRYAVNPPPVPMRSVNEFFYPMDVIKASGIDTTYMCGTGRPLSILREKYGVNPSASPVRVCSVESSGREVQTYDIEVRDIEQFTADGFVVHNSAVYDFPDGVPVETFMEEWLALVKSKSGERGIFNRQAALRHSPARRVWGNSQPGCNPCAEILLKPFEFCNLSIAVARPDDTPETLTRKVRLAAYFGTIQSMATRFNYIRPDWAINCREERLLGVDITGHADCPILHHTHPGRAELLRRLRDVALNTNRMLADRWGINVSAAVTTVKPSGDSAVFFDCGSGVSPRFAAHQIRWVRESKTSPIARFLIDSGVPYADSPEAPAELYVFAFPKAAPPGATLRNDMTALDQLENWLVWKTNWAEHSVSATIYVDDHEWPAVGAWVYAHMNEITGLSFLPRDNGTYTYAPNEELTPDAYERMMAAWPTLNWAKLPTYETEDMTESAQTFACVGEKC